LLFHLDCISLVYGTETIRDLVPKVIRILELLELQAAINEKEIDEIAELKKHIAHLELDKSETRELRQKFDREVESIEEQWRKEVTSHEQDSIGVC
jgi:RILP-like protein 1